MPFSDFSAHRTRIHISILRIESQIQEYPAPWLDGSKNILRDSSGRFASSDEDENDNEERVISFFEENANKAIATINEGYEKTVRALDRKQEQGQQILQENIEDFSEILSEQRDRVKSQIGNTLQQLKEMGAIAEQQRKRIQKGATSFFDEKLDPFLEDRTSESFVRSLRSSLVSIQLLQEKPTEEQMGQAMAAAMEVGMFSLWVGFDFTKDEILTKGTHGRILTRAIISKLAGILTAKGVDKLYKEEMVPEWAEDKKTLISLGAAFLVGTTTYAGFNKLFPEKGTKEINEVIWDGFFQDSHSR